MYERRDDSGWLVTLDAELVRRTDWDLPMRGFTRFDFDPYIRLVKLRLLLD